MTEPVVPVALAGANLDPDRPPYPPSRDWREVVAEIEEQKAREVGRQHKPPGRRPRAALIVSTPTGLQLVLDQLHRERGQGHPIPPELRAEVRRRLALGETQQRVATALDLGLASVSRIARAG